jgi:heat shock protein HtpX
VTTEPAAETRCPRCQATLSTQRGAVPWCPQCEWGLDRYEPDRRRPEFGWGWVDRRLFRLAYRLTDRQYSTLLGRPVGRGGRGPARFVLTAAAVALSVAVVALLALGVYLIAHQFPSWRIAPGALLLLVALALWPRLGRPDRQGRRLRREQAPALFRLVDDVAAAVGAPVPHVVEVDSTFNASTSAVGLRRRRVLRLGLPMWAVLPPQQRVALLGHELGHFVNGDARRGPVTRVPLTTLGRLADLLRPGRPMRNQGLAGVIGGAVAVVLLGSARRVVQAGHVGLVWVCLRDSQRAEYLADELSARAAGSTAAAQLADTLVLSDALFMAARREARKGAAAADWSAAADTVRSEVVPRLAGARQLSVRDEVSLFATHPPTGLRARMIESRPYQPAAVTLTAAGSVRIDEELAKSYDIARRDIAAL